MHRVSKVNAGATEWQHVGRRSWGGGLAVLRAGGVPDRGRRRWCHPFPLTSNRECCSGVRWPLSSAGGAAQVKDIGNEVRRAAQVQRVLATRPSKLRLRSARVRRQVTQAHRACIHGGASRGGRAPWPQEPRWRGRGRLARRWGEASRAVCGRRAVGKGLRCHGVCLAKGKADLHPKSLGQSQMVARMAPEGHCLLQIAKTGFGARARRRWTAKGNRAASTYEGRRRT